MKDDPPVCGLFTIEMHSMDGGREKDVEGGREGGERGRKLISLI